MIRSISILLAIISIASADYVVVDWNTKIGICNTTTTLQVVVNPTIRRESAIHDNVFKYLEVSTFNLCFADLQNDFFFRECEKTMEKMK